jgi:mannitol/fructose-specific phosphotransferase system IIA component
MKICAICHRISATDQDHLDCIQKIRIEFEDEEFKRSIPEKLELAKNSQNLGIEVRAILEHLTKENKKDNSS